MHLPFCAAKCHYCDFFSEPVGDRDTDETIAALLVEAASRAPLRPRTVFIGGGTPSLLRTSQLERLLDELNRITTFRDSAREVSIECNPESLDAEKASALIGLGVNRFSIGFQSLEPATLRLFGRVHDVEQSFQAYDAARTAGASSVNVDLIYAAPGHRPDNWNAALNRVLDLQPDHLAAYNLAFERQTLFSQWLERGEIAPLDEELELELFSITRERAEAYGLPPYEISNYARPGHECLHNLENWSNGEYIGIGPSAVSHVGGLRSGNVWDLGEYLRRVSDEKIAAEWSERLAPRAKLGETWWLGLRRTSGVDPAEARRAAGWVAPDDPALQTAIHLVECGHLQVSGDRYCLSAKAIPLADAISAEFLVPDSSEE